MSSERRNKCIRNIGLGLGYLQDIFKNRWHAKKSQYQKVNADYILSLLPYFIQGLIGMPSVASVLWPDWVELLFFMDAAIWHF